MLYSRSLTYGIIADNIVTYKYTNKYFFFFSILFFFFFYELPSYGLKRPPSITLGIKTYQINPIL